MSAGTLADGWSSAGGRPAGAGMAGVVPARRAGWPEAGAAALVALAPLLFVYLPRPPVPGAQFLVYPAMAGVLALLVGLLVRSYGRVARPVVLVVLLLLAYSVCIAASLFANAAELRMTAPAEIFRPAVIAVFFLYGYFAAVHGGDGAVHRGLAWAAYGILAGQLVIALTQIAGLPVFDLLYNAEKARPIGQLLRATGSLANPNIFAWVVAQAAVLVSLTGSGRSRWAWLGLATVLVLISGSRTLLLLFPFMCAFAQVLRDPTNVRTYARYAAYALLLVGVFGLVVFQLGDVFPYLAELRTVVSTGSLTSIYSMAARLEMWETRYLEFQQGGALAWVVGVGSRETNAVVDNDFLYVFFRYGGLGLFVHLLVTACALVLFARARRHAVAVAGMQYIVFALVYGLVAESLASWHVPLLLFAYLGLSVGLRARPSDVVAASASRGG